MVHRKQLFFILVVICKQPTTWNPETGICGDSGDGGVLAGTSLGQALALCPGSLQARSGVQRTHPGHHHSMRLSYEPGIQAPSVLPGHSETLSVAKKQNSLP